MGVKFWGEVERNEGSQEPDIWKIINLRSTFNLARPLL